MAIDQHRHTQLHDTAANWAAINPTLEAGAIGVESDTLKIKIGDGAAQWTGLPYAVDLSGYATTADLDALSGTYGTQRTLPAGALASIVGSPSLSVASSFDSVWLLDAAAIEGVSGALVLPPGWATIDLYVWWVNAGAGAGAVVFQGLFLGYADGESLGTGAMTAVTATAAAQNVVKRTSLGSRTLTGGDLSRIGLQRRAADAGDTLANDAGVLAIEIVRAS